MTESNSDSGFLLLRNGNLIGIILSLIVTLSGFTAHSQSYFYFENKIPRPQGDSSTYFSFLVLDQDGTALLRLRTTANNPLVEQKMKDSVYPDNAPKSGLKYLVPEGDANDIINGKSLGIKLRFVFKAQMDIAGTYYIPYRTEYAGADSIWQTTDNVFEQQKTYEDLVNQPDFVSLFYKKNEPFLDYLYGPRDRANPGIARNEKLFLIVVGNTKDAKIGTTSKEDVDHITGTFTTLAANLGMRIITQKIIGNDFTKKNLDQALKNLKKEKPSMADIVVFYYSGHGFRYSNDKSLYPRMLMTTTDSSTVKEINKNNMQIEDVFKQIKKLGARLNLVLSDCCNDDIGVPVPEGRDILKTRGFGFNTTSQSLNMVNCNALFFYPQPASIIVTSAEINQLALGTPGMGGFFTYYFKALLEQSLYSYQKSDSWINLLLAAKEKARYQALTARCGSGRCTQLATMDMQPMAR